MRSFYDSNGDGQGDLNGLIARLDYLNDGQPASGKSLGVTALWLMPIMPASSYHGYDAEDYRGVAPAYGSLNDLRRLLDEAHRRGMRVIIDWPFNHTSSRHPWFVESSQGPASARRDWYLWSASDPGFRGPERQNVWHARNGAFYYGVFGAGMPDLNYATPAVTAAAYDTARFWLQDVGVDGFRMDAARYLIEENLLQANRRLVSTPSTIAWLRDFRSFYRDLAPQSLSIGEVWSDSDEAARYVREGALDLTFEFGLADAILRSINAGQAAEFHAGLAWTLRAFPAGQYGVFLTNHDQNRVASRLSSVADARLAATILFTLPGTPFVYYGEEIGMTGVKPDEQIRAPMQWSAAANAGFTTGSPWTAVRPDYAAIHVAAQEQDPASLWNLYRQLIRLRRERPALRAGALLPLASASDKVDAYLRLAGADRLLVALNFGSKPQVGVVLSLTQSDLPAGVYAARDALSGADFPVLTVGANGAIAGYALPTLTERGAVILSLTSR